MNKICIQKSTAYLTSFVSFIASASAIVGIYYLVTYMNDYYKSNEITTT